MTSWREKPGWYWLSSTMPASAIIAFQYDQPWVYLGWMIAAILVCDTMLGEHVVIENQHGDVSSTWIAVPLGFICLWLIAVLDSTARIKRVTMLEFAGLTVACGVLGAFAMAHIHEVMHRDSRWGRRACDMAMTLAGYPHYRLVHELHHAHVADPQFGSTAPIGLSLWRHLGRSFGNSLIAVLAEDRRRLAQGRKRRIWFSASVWLGTVVVFVSLFGPRGLLFYVGQSAISIFIVETIGYIQHYGLVDGGGPVAWNAHSWLSNRLFVNNGLHAHHHLEQTLPYERLECWGAKLPAGYMQMFFLALVPPLWFSVMNRHQKMLANCHSTNEWRGQE
ncbi:fatty acid desaturase [Paraburkholderia heleia]|uniref:fatty acid desaturase n=1 Tax=Paraburkholderia heleia TaxID=634127 RepID=UPI002AB6C022|nr:fatty acid desaturase [Paraburkholderia heleia]